MKDALGFDRIEVLVPRSLAIRPLGEIYTMPDGVQVDSNLTGSLQALPNKFLAPNIYAQRAGLSPAPNYVPPAQVDNFNITGRYIPDFSGGGAPTGGAGVDFGNQIGGSGGSSFVSGGGHTGLAIHFNIAPSAIQSQAPIYQDYVQQAQSQEALAAVGKSVLRIPSTVANVVNTASAPVGFAPSAPVSVKQVVIHSGGLTRSTQSVQSAQYIQRQGQSAAAEQDTLANQEAFYRNAAQAARGLQAAGVVASIAIPVINVGSRIAAAGLAARAAVATETAAMTSPAAIYEGQFAAAVAKGGDFANIGIEMMGNLSPVLRATSSILAARAATIVPTALNAAGSPMAILASTILPVTTVAASGVLSSRVPSRVAPTSFGWSDMALGETNIAGMNESAPIGTLQPTSIIPQIAGLPSSSMVLPSADIQMPSLGLEHALSLPQVEGRPDSVLVPSVSQMELNRQQIADAFDTQNYGAASDQYGRNIPLAQFSPLLTDKQKSPGQLIREGNWGELALRGLATTVGGIISIGGKAVAVALVPYTGGASLLAGAFTGPAGSLVSRNISGVQPTPGVAVTNVPIGTTGNKTFDMVAQIAQGTGLLGLGRDAFSGLFKSTPAGTVAISNPSTPEEMSTLRAQYAGIPASPTFAKYLPRVTPNVDPYLDPAQYALLAGLPPPAPSATVAMNSYLDSLGFHQSIDLSKPLLPDITPSVSPGLLLGGNRWGGGGVVSAAGGPIISMSVASSSMPAMFASNGNGGMTTNGANSAPPNAIGNLAPVQSILASTPQIGNPSTYISQNSPTGGGMSSTDFTGTEMTQSSDQLSVLTSAAPSGTVASSNPLTQLLVPLAMAMLTS